MPTRASSLASFGVPVVLALGAIGCGGSFGRLTSAERIPADGSLGGPGPTALKVQQVTNAEWAGMPKKKLAPACDARGGTAKADKASIDKANAAITAWTDYLKANPKPAPKQPTGPTVGDVVGMKRTDGSRTLTSLAFECAEGKPATIAMSGTSYTFDLAWVSEKGKRFGIQALSLKDQKVYFVMIATPATPKDKSDEIAIVANVASYFPADADEPIVVADKSSIDPRFETFVFGKGKTQGFYWLVPLSPDLSIERYLGVGAFAVGG